MTRIPVGALFAIAIAIAAAAARAAGPGEIRFAFEQPHMATVWRVTVYAPSEVEARAAAEAAFDRVAELERVMSDYDPGSEVRGLGIGWRPLSDDLLAVLEAAGEMASASGGAFDVTVGPLARAWKRAIRRGEMPRADVLAAARTATGPGMLELDLDGRRARLGSGEARVDLGGIGKGFALDAALEIVRVSHRLPRVLIDAGGDVLAGDPPPGKAGWVVEIRGNGSPWLVSLANASVATSGDLHQHAVIGGTRVSHLIDPRSGEALHDGAAATVIAGSATTADALASALCVLAECEGLALAKQLGAVARVNRSPGGRRPGWSSPGMETWLGDSPGELPGPAPATRENGRITD